MKTIIFLAILATAMLSMSSVALSQSSSGYTWSGWQSDPCFSGIQFRTRYSNYNDSAKKHEWRIQYKNSYAKKVAFSYVLGGSREAIAKYVNTYGAEYRGSINPGQTSDPNMWTFTDNAAMLWEVIGHVRFLAPDQIDVGPDPYSTCDSQGNRGMIDYICRNDPTPDFDCQNHVKSTPAAKTLPFSGGRKPSNATPASAEECLNMYERFSANKNATDLVTLNKAGEAAGEFRERCKLTPDQTVFIDKELSQSSIRMDALKRQLSSGPSDTFVVQADAEKKHNVDGLKRQILEEIDSLAERKGLVSFVENSIVTTDFGKLDCEVNCGRVPVADAVFHPFSGLSKPVFCVGNLKMWGSSSVCIYLDRRKFANEGEDYFSKIKKINTVLDLLKLAINRSSTNGSNDPNEESSDSDRGQNPFTVELYQRKVNAAAKAAGKIPPAKKPAQTTKQSPPLTPKQRVARNAEAQNRLFELMQKDIAEEVSGTKNFSEGSAATRPVESATKVAVESVFIDPSVSLRFTIELPGITTGKWLAKSIPRPEGKTFAYTHEDNGEMKRIELSALPFEAGQLNITTVVKARRMSLASLASSGFVINGEEPFSLGVVSGTMLEWSDKVSRRRSYYFPNSDGGYYYVGITGPADWVKAEGDKIIKSIRFK